MKRKSNKKWKIVFILFNFWRLSKSVGLWIGG